MDGDPQPEPDAPFFMGMGESHKTIFGNLVVVLREQVNGSLSPVQLDGLATLILALDRLPLTTPGLDCTLTLKRILDDIEPMGQSYLSHMIIASESSLEISVGGAIYSDAGSDGFTDFSLYVSADDEPCEPSLWDAIAWMASFQSDFALPGVDLKFKNSSTIAPEYWEADSGWEFWPLLAEMQARARAAEEGDEAWEDDESSDE